ncbi:hypothetical protein JWG45_06465 [Leptospira sp. 201903070]|uniref:Uncharacterized protein n=1 Tax=Leptospira ainlahdjerensis TaxID=2810033 RepID=A0ABS2U8V5_9LEPT|nr:hypothetical protein [Leptospira ainlahdjerensis]MBM9576795.1 hypothetical protein [Leptospira ainlahdjerensis]
MDLIKAEWKVIRDNQLDLNPNQRIAFLNSYFSEMEKIAYRSAGFVDKCVSAAVFALFADYDD